MYKAVVLTTLLNGCETWTVYKRHTKKLNHFHTTRLSKLLGINLQDRVPDTEVLNRAGLPSIQTILMKSQLRWAGHVARMPDNRIPKKLLFGELQVGKRSVIVPQKRYKDTPKASLKAFGVNPNSWEQAATNTTKWRAAIHGGARRHEDDRKDTAERRMQERKDKAMKPRAPGSIPCPHCNRTFQDSRDSRFFISFLAPIGVWRNTQEYKSKKQQQI